MKFPFIFLFAMHWLCGLNSNPISSESFLNFLCQTKVKIDILQMASRPTRQMTFWPCLCTTQSSHSAGFFSSSVSTGTCSLPRLDNSHWCPCKCVRCVQCHNFSFFFDVNHFCDHCIIWMWSEAWWILFVDSFALLTFVRTGAFFQLTILFLFDEHKWFQHSLVWNFLCQREWDLCQIWHGWQILWWELCVCNQNNA